MYCSVNEFLQAHYATICEMRVRAATRVGGHYAQMTAAARRCNAEQDAREYILALSLGAIDREAVRTAAAQPAPTGLVADDLLRLTSMIEPWIKDLVTHELACQPALRDQLLHRLDEVHTSFRANLFGTKIDLAITQSSRMEMKRPL
jgi:hypothetical protein